jgi:acetyl-CoA/propionyl-CoA carboxylase biotin carboxyl carrier protein
MTRMHELSPVLIANRGEIAIRVARTVHALGLSSVGVVTEADSGSAHADASDMVVSIGSYLDASEVLRAARLSGARSVHPGYGFLSENAAFARAVVEAGLVWIGPPPEAIELMGDKGAAKDAAAAAGVPVVPAGDDGGFPVVVKAVAGGGGKGMRVVRAADELQGATAAAQREALAAFGDDRVIVERYLERPRHIEIQVLADAHGACVHLGERECSLQRRHQKVVEEAPSPVVDAALRARMGEAAVTLARACGYVGVGTVEFIATGDASTFYFLEMNTRLQVEHPVTELVYGVDLVEQQLRVAAGEPLALEQEALVPHGHAVEARLYAEDPAAGFLPAVGTVRVYREPSGPGVRVDSGIRSGSEVGTSYDPMLAKVIAYGPDRATALARLDRALASYAIAGVTTNAAFSRALLARADVRAGEQDTGLLERILAEPAAAPPEDLVAAAMVAAARSARPPGPWRRALDGHGEARVGGGRVRVGERSWTADGPRAVEAPAAGPRDGMNFGATAAGARVATAAGTDNGFAGELFITLDGVQRRYAVAVSGDAVWIARDGHHLEVRTERHTRGGAGAAAGSLEAPMPGTVLLVHVADGDTVAEGDVLLVLESMKMELSITAPHAGTVAGLALAPGDRVALKQPLVAVVAQEVVA